MRTKVIVIWLSAAFLLAGIQLSSRPVGAATLKFQELVAAAKKEAAQGTTFLVYASNPREEKTRQAFFDAFKKRYSMPNFKFEWLTLHPSVAVPRLVAEARAGRTGPDVVMSSANTLLEADKAGLLESFNWSGTFGAEFPDIKEPTEDRVPTELKGKWVVVYDATRSFNFNSDQLKASDAPNELEDLADPKWSRRFAMNSSGASPFDLFMLAWGEERVVNLVKKLIANKPIFKKGTPAVVNAISAGEAPVGFGSIHEAERLKVMKGAPIDWKTYGNYIPVLSQGYSTTKKSRHPNLSHLFIAWLATDGMPIYEKMEFSTRVTRKGSFLNKLIQERAPNAKVLEPKSQKEFDAFEAFGDKLDKMIAGSVTGQ
jgi:iron(III) transport system substrate-binding protein